MFLAISNCGLTIEEAFLGVTYHSAKSLGLESTNGLIEENYTADLIFWNIDSLEEIPYWISSRDKINMIMKSGKIIQI